MAKEDKKEKAARVIPEGMKCFQKTGGGNWRPVSNRIIKQGQKFWIIPEAIPAGFADAFKEVAPDYKAVIIEANVPVFYTKNENTNVAEKFEVILAVDEDGEVLKKGTAKLYNVIDESGKPLNDKPLRKLKAEELLAALNL